MRFFKRLGILTLGAWLLFLLAAETRYHTVRANDQAIWVFDRFTGQPWYCSSSGKCK
jgi:hypothetical protein